MERKKEQILEILPSLVKKYEDVKQEAFVYEGYKAISTAYEECSEELEKGEDSLFISIGEEDFSDEKTQLFYMNLSAKRKARGLKMRGIALPSTKEIFRKYPAKINMRYAELNLPTGVSIYKTKVILVSWQDKPTAIVIKSQNITNSYRAFFEDMWKLAKK